MNDRDFKLLVREYFQAKSRVDHAPMLAVVESTRKLDDLEKRILSELEAFTKRDVDELPFKD